VAAVAIEHAALVCSADDDFRRFEGVQLFNPLAGDQMREPLLAYQRA